MLRSLDTAVQGVVGAAVGFGLGLVIAGTIFLSK
jgi:hypothetical protein